MLPGASVERTARLVGRKFTYGYAVTEQQADRMFDLRVDRPFPMLVRCELDVLAD